MGRTKCDDCGQMTTTPISGAMYKHHLVVADYEAVCRECYGKRVLEAEAAPPPVSGKSTEKPRRTAETVDPEPVKLPETVTEVAKNIPEIIHPLAAADLAFREFINRVEEGYKNLKYTKP
ncbi:MAG: hypothetical protein HGB02_08495 [Chlorobiaceae bacterium]|nr:hypothetical protein [Chlorobiaceae bacterium]